MTDAQEEALAVLRQNAPNPVVLHVAVGGKLVMLGKRPRTTPRVTASCKRPTAQPDERRPRARAVTSPTPRLIEG